MILLHNFSYKYDFHVYNNKFQMENTFVVKKSAEKQKKSLNYLTAFTFLNTKQFGIGTRFLGWVLHYAFSRLSIKYLFSFANFLNQIHFDIYLIPNADCYGFNWFYVLKTCEISTPIHINSQRGNSLKIADHHVDRKIDVYSLIWTMYRLCVTFSIWVAFLSFAINEICTFFQSNHLKIKKWLNLFCNEIKLDWKIESSGR